MIKQNYIIRGVIMSTKRYCDILLDYCLFTEREIYPFSYVDDIFCTWICLKSECGDAEKLKQLKEVKK